MRCLSIIRKYSVLSVAALSVLTSCKDDDKGSLDNILPAAPANSIVKVLGADPQYSTFVAALQKANVAQTLDGRYPGTVFAPTNQAFTDAGIDVNSMSGADLAPVLRYHIVPGTQAASSFAGKNVVFNSTFPNSSGNRLFVFSNGNTSYINGSAQITQTDKQADNGVIHTINKVLVPPTGNTVAVLQGDSANYIYLNTLIAAVDTSKKPDGNPYRVVQAVTNDSTTLLAPNNAALIATLGLTAGSDAATVAANKAAIVAKVKANAATYFNILAYHVVPKVFAFSTSLSNGPVMTAAGTNITVNTANGVAITDATGNTATVTKADLVTYNGVVHQINRVLIPQQ